MPRLYDTPEVCRTYFFPQATRRYLGIGLGQRRQKAYSDPVLITRSRIARAGSEPLPEVRCPSCQRSPLLIHRSCLDLHFGCPECRSRFSLAELAPVLDGPSFARLAEAVADRPADRV
jgi:hypothetical protein